MGMDAGVVAGTVRRGTCGVRGLGHALGGQVRRQRARGAAELLRRVRGPVLGAATTLLVVAAGWPAGSWASSGPEAGSAVIDPAQGRASVTGLAASVPLTVPGGAAALPPVAPLRQLFPADLLVVWSQPLPPAALSAVRQLRGVRAAEPVDAATVGVNGKQARVLGVDPSGFRRFAAKPTASDNALWRSVAAGDIAVSYTMGRQDGLPAGSLAEVAGRQMEILPVGGLGTVGISGVDAVVSHAVARSLGFQAGNALVISAALARLPALKSKIKAIVPPTAEVYQLVAPPSAVTGGSSTSAASVAGSAGTGGLLTPAQVTAFLQAAVSTIGMP